MVLPMAVVCWAFVPITAAEQRRIRTSLPYVHRFFIWFDGLFVALFLNPFRN